MRALADIIYPLAILSIGTGFVAGISKGEAGFIALGLFVGAALALVAEALRRAP